MALSRLIDEETARFSKIDGNVAAKSRKLRDTLCARFRPSDPRPNPTDSDIRGALSDLVTAVNVLLAEAPYDGAALTLIVKQPTAAPDPKQKK